MTQGQAIREPERLLMMAIELDHAPEPVTEAVETLASAHLDRLVRLLDRAPPESSVARAAWGLAMRPETLRRLLDDESPDFETLELLLARIGPDRADVLLDLLCESDSLATRKRLLTRLVELAPRIERELMRRSRDPRWYARRNVLVLMGELRRWPAKWSPAPFVEDPHPAVRREALKLMLKRPALRDRALCGLLTDDDPRARSLGLAAATESCPPEAVPLLADLVEKEGAPAEHRVLAIRALGRSGEPAAVEPLLRVVRRGAGLAPNRLAEKSPVMVAGLQALATFPGDIGRGRKLLARASRSRDSDIRGALGREAP
ncbi:MAG: HEAT repeat domain-containing protein [Gemmatimonadota bacterium]|nr:HEAT repeat domain-containing protein [Gemmatimonadota bacterium]